MSKRLGWQLLSTALAYRRHAHDWRRLAKRFPHNAERFERSARRMFGLARDHLAWAREELATDGDSERTRIWRAVTPRHEPFAEAAE